MLQETDSASNVQVTADQLPPGLERTPVAIPMHGNEMFIVRLSQFSQVIIIISARICFLLVSTLLSVAVISPQLAWSTLKADLLFVVWELMGGKTRLGTQTLLIQE